MKDDSSKGEITSGISPNAYVLKTLEFVYNELPFWRDQLDRKKVKTENILNFQLCNHLDVEAREKLKMVHFKNEVLQTKTRRVDIGAQPTQGVTIANTYYSKNDPFIVIEGKRLPAPRPKKRQREYATGGNELTGGIQRFKLGLHGNEHAQAIVIGYIQKGTTSEWLALINSWIDDLVLKPTTAPENWDSDEKLFTSSEDIEAKTMYLTSKHHRLNHCDIVLSHFWVVMEP